MLCVLCVCVRVCVCVCVCVCVLLCLSNSCNIGAVVTNPYKSTSNVRTEEHGLVAGSSVY